MDRELDPREHRRRWLRRAAWGLLAAVTLWLLWAWLPEVLRPAIRRNEIRTAKVERGSLEASVLATGTVIPAFEQVVSSPIDARVVRILKRPGERVRRGEEILELDTAEARLAFETLNEQVAQKSNEQEQLRLQLVDELGDLRTQTETRELDYRILEYRLAQQRKLHEDGLTSEEAFRQAEVEVRKAEVELEGLRRSVSEAELMTAARRERLELDVRILKRERDEAARRLERATTRSDVDGILTWVVEDLGATVTRGANIARVADLGAFRIEASVSDIYASRLAVGQPVKVHLDRDELSATLSNIYPAIEAGTVRFGVALAESDHPKLRQNLRVDVQVVTNRLDDVLMVRKGPFAQPTGGDQRVFVMQGNRAVRTDARLGVSGYEHFEIVDGLAEGGEIIISSMQDYLHLKEVRIK